MKLDLWRAYEHMLRSRLFEEAVAEVWRQGGISGEMHLGIGEEAIVAGTVLQLQDGDAMALDHRGTAPMVMRGVSMSLLMDEFMGRPDGLCAGRGGHMHLFSKEHLSASSGIVGASGPAAVGFGLAARRLRPGKVALAFFGEGAMNQGMLMEAFNLAVVWNLPVIFVCKDNKWAITTLSANVTGGRLVDRSRSFGMPTAAVDGQNIRSVWRAVDNAIQRARSGRGPSFILASCFRPDGHFLGDPLLRIARHPVKEMKKVTGPLMKSVASKGGASLTGRGGGLGRISYLICRSTKEQMFRWKDPLKKVRRKLKSDQKRLQLLEDNVNREITRLVEVLHDQT